MPRKRFKKGKRVDMRGGGRVALARGVRNTRRTPPTRIPPEDPIATTPVTAAGQTGTPGTNISGPEYEAAKADATAQAAKTRVTLGNRPQRKDYPSKDIYQAELEAWRGTKENAATVSKTKDPSFKDSRTGVEDILPPPIESGVEDVIDKSKMPPPKEVDPSIKAKTITQQERDPAKLVKAEVAPMPSAATGATAVSQQQAPITADTYGAAQVGEEVFIEGAEGVLSEGAKAKVDEIRELSGPAEAQKITDALVNAAKANNVEGIISAGAYTPEVTGIGAQVSATSNAEKQTREAITGTTATGVEAQIINNIGFDAAQRSTVQGTARTGAAATMVAQTAAIPQEIAAAIVEDPATVEAKIDTEPVEVQAAVAALPTEALVSSQMESLVGGLESGNIPAWAKPAVDAMNQRMEERGMAVSTVGRDAMFNAIIQNALPLAQSNAQALQARAAQNLSNEQQANLTQATQDMQRRMANLANQQTAASQTAANAQQMSVMQSQFKQEAVLTTAQQQQQTAMANLQNQQQAAVLNAQNEQAINAQNLSVGAQMDLANLQIQDATARENMSAIQQERLVEYQTAAQFLSQNAGFKQQMNLANLSSDQQMRIANLSAQNQAGAENLSAEQQTELANLNKRMQINIRNSELANTMGLAQLNVDQQRAMQNAGMVANMDMTKFTTEQQVELANSKWMQTAGLTNLNNEQQAALQDATALASLDLATLDQRTRISAQHAQAFLQMDMANLNNDQQAVVLSAQQRQQRMLSNQSAENAARQFNSASENQTNQFMTNLAQQIEMSNTTSLNAMEQFNTQQVNANTAMQAGINADLAKANATIATDLNRFNTQIEFNRDNWNATNSQAIEQANVAWRRQANTINTAAANQVSMQNAQNAFGLRANEQAYLWQEARDKANYIFQGHERELDRQTSLLLKSMTTEGQVTVQESADDGAARRLVFAKALDFLFKS